MAEHFFSLTRKDRREALEHGRAESGRPAHLLEKDVWVVWTLRALSIAAGIGLVIFILAPNLPIAFVGVALWGAGASLGFAGKEVGPAAGWIVLQGRLVIQTRQTDLLHVVVALSSPGRLPRRLNGRQQ